MSKSIATNRNAFRNYHIGDKYECGISLLGNEVKSIKSNRININGSYVAFIRSELYLINAHISPLANGELFDPTRSRTLLLNKKEILKIIVYRFIKIYLVATEPNGLMMQIIFKNM